MLHSWEVLASILSSDKTSDILCDIGMCVHFHAYYALLLASSLYIIHSADMAVRIQNACACAGQ